MKKYKSLIIFTVAVIIIQTICTVFFSGIIITSTDQLNQENLNLDKLRTIKSELEFQKSYYLSNEYLISHESAKE